jgi:hypothetical protein
MSKTNKKINSQNGEVKISKNFPTITPLLSFFDFLKNEVNCEGEVFTIRYFPRKPLSERLKLQASDIPATRALREEIKELDIRSADRKICITRHGG